VKTNQATSPGVCPQVVLNGNVFTDTSLAAAGATTPTSSTSSLNDHHRSQRTATVA
jgi:hypothetical protein